MYKTYCNATHGYCIDYPSDILSPQPETATQNSQVFESKDQRSTLMIFRDLRDKLNPAVKFDISTAYEEDIDTSFSSVKKTVTYKKLEKTFYVISGIEAGKIYYRKTAFTKDGLLVTCKLSYAEEDRKIYDVLVESILNSLK